MRKEAIVVILGSKNKFADIARHEEETIAKERIEGLAWLHKRVEEAERYIGLELLG